MAGPLTPVVDGRLRHGPHFNAKGRIPTLTNARTERPDRNQCGAA